jgi:hypothetical protein
MIKKEEEEKNDNKNNNEPVINSGQHQQFYGLKHDNPFDLIKSYMLQKYNYE